MISATSNMGTSESEVLHEFIERIGQRIADLTSQMGIDLSCSRTTMTKIFLDDAQVDAGFQKMSRVGVSQRVHVRVAYGWIGELGREVAMLALMDLAQHVESASSLLGSTASTPSYVYTSEKAGHLGFDQRRRLGCLLLLGTILISLAERDCPLKCAFDTSTSEDKSG